MQIFIEHEYLIYVAAGIAFAVCGQTGAYRRLRMTLATWPKPARIPAETITSLYVVYVAVLVIALQYHSPTEPTGWLLFASTLVSSVATSAAIILARPQVSPIENQTTSQPAASINIAAPKGAAPGAKDRATVTNGAAAQKT